MLYHLAQSSYGSVCGLLLLQLTTPATICRDIHQYLIQASVRLHPALSLLLWQGWATLGLTQVPVLGQVCSVPHCDVTRHCALVLV